MRNAEEMLHLLSEALVDGKGVAALPGRACSAAARALECDGGAITLEYTGRDRVTLCATDATMRVVEDAQDVTGQGPGTEAFRSGQYVSLQLDGADDGLDDSRWPLLGTTAVGALGPVVVHAVPLLAGTQVFGVLTLLRRGVGHAFDVPTALDVARLVAGVVLASSPGALDEHWPGPWNERAEVHQATGMVVAQLHIGEDDALALLRAHAYATGNSLHDTARAVVERRLRLAGSAEEETG